MINLKDDINSMQLNISKYYQETANPKQSGNGTLYLKGLSASIIQKILSSFYNQEIFIEVSSISEFLYIDEWSSSERISEISAAKSLQLGKKNYFPHIFLNQKIS